MSLAYVQLSHPGPTLSSGEPQRVKLYTELSKRTTCKTLYLTYEPMTGFSFYDVHNLMDVMHRLVDKRNSMLVIEHKLDVICCSDWIIDLDPNGAEIVVTGTSEDVAEHQSSHIGPYLKQLSEQHPQPEKAVK